MCEAEISVWQNLLVSVLMMYSCVFYLCQDGCHLNLKEVIPVLCLPRATSGLSPSGMYTKSLVNRCFFRLFEFTKEEAPIRCMTMTFSEPSLSRSFLEDDKPYAASCRLRVPKK